MAPPLTQTTGRRKEAIARARLRPGTGVVTVNGRTFESYFTTPAHRMEALEPLRVARGHGALRRRRHDLRWRRQRTGRRAAHGAGPVTGRDRAREPRLAEEGRLLTRDARKKESKKYGLKKARKAPQFTKR